jgi:hypothetical protein
LGRNPTFKLAHCPEQGARIAGAADFETRVVPVIAIANQPCAAAWCPLSPGTKWIPIRRPIAAA